MDCSLSYVVLRLRPCSQTLRSRHQPDLLVEAHDLHKTYPPRGNSGAFTAVDGVSFELRRGEAFGFLGPNGAGKSSTMRMISCVSPVTSGTLRVLGMETGHRRPRASGPGSASCRRTTASTAS